MSMRWSAGAVTVLLLAGCAGPSTRPGADPDLAIDRATDPTARYVAGTLTALRPTTNTLMIVSGKTVEELNEVVAEWNAHTRFYLDNQPTTLDRLRQYMPVRATGHMIDGRFVLDVVKAGSQLPPNVQSTTR